MAVRSGNLTLDELETLIDKREIDTVIVAFPDMQGRLVGKRVSARLFREDVAAARRGGLQLPARGRRRDEHGRRLRDVELGDRLRRHGADARLRHPAARALASGHRDRDGRPDLARRASRSSPSPARDPARRQLARLAERGLVALRRHRARVHRLRRQLPRGLGEGLPGPHPGIRLQHRLRAARLDPHGAAAARHPPRHGRRRHVLRGRQGRVQLRPAGDRVPLHRGARHLRQPHDLQERREGDRRPARQGAHLHGEVQRARGQQLPHPPLGARHRRASR